MRTATATTTTTTTTTTIATSRLLFFVCAVAPRGVTVDISVDISVDDTVEIGGRKDHPGG